jgi:hypothetical protein
VRAQLADVLLEICKKAEQLFDILLVSLDLAGESRDKSFKTL